MLCKLVLVASLAVGVFRPVTSSYNRYGAYELAMENIPAKHCHTKEKDLAFDAFVECLVEIDSDAILELGTGVYGGPIRKYCAKSPQLKECTRSFIKDVGPCLPPEEVRIFENTIFRLTDFLCLDGGARIISLLELRYDKQTSLALVACKQSIIARKPRNIFKEKCSIMDDGMSCITNALKTCASKTPAEFSQELHNLLLDSMACSGVSIIHQNGVLRLMLAIIFFHLLIVKFNNKC